MLVENICVQTLIWGTTLSLRGPKSYLDWFLSLGSITIFIVVFYFLIIEQKNTNVKLRLKTFRKV